MGHGCVRFKALVVKPGASSKARPCKYTGLARNYSPCYRLLVITGSGPCQAPVTERPPLCSRLRTEGAMSKIDDIDSPARYRRLARDCLEMARTVASEGPRATLVEMAQIWMRLAGTEEGRQVAQQQQQTQPKADDKKE